MKKNIRTWIVIAFMTMLVGLLSAAEERYFPDIPEYQTLVCDFHTHTVFSDGQVWPTVRIDEAKKEGLDALALTDHIEYQPHKDDIPTNHNRPYEIATEPAQEKDILLIKGAEITRDTPPGHYNSIFAIDIDLIDKPEFLDAIKAANEQNCFVFWNHHAWKGEERGQWTDLQTQMLKNKWLHGMEVANGGEYYPNAHQWCLEKNLTMLGNSDIHAPSWFYPYKYDNHRTLTLVFAKERSVESIQEALFEGRTAVWYKNQVIGRKQFLVPLFNTCVTFSAPKPHTEDTVLISIHNKGLVMMDLESENMLDKHYITIPPRHQMEVPIKIDPAKKTGTLSYRVRNFLVAPKKGLYFSAEFSMPEPAAVAKSAEEN